MRSAHDLLSPAKHVSKVYYAKIDGRVTEEDVNLFENGVDIGEEKRSGAAELLSGVFATFAGQFLFHADRGKNSGRGTAEVSFRLSDLVGGTLLLLSCDPYIFKQDTAGCESVAFICIS